MAVVDFSQNAFNQGEVGDYIVGRTDLEIYRKSAELVENFICLPHGGVQYRRGFEFVRELAGVDPDEVLLVKFDFNKQQQYVLIFSHLQITILRDKQLAATIVRPYPGSSLRDLRWAQSGDTMILVHPDFTPRKLVRLIPHTVWEFSDLTIRPYAFLAYYKGFTVTPSATTGAITVTLSGTEGYWNAGHAQSVQIKINTKRVTLTGFPTNATGGTALSSAGTAANAFDSNTGTRCSAGTDGWIGYAFAGAVRVKVIGINRNVTTTLHLTFEVDDNDSFTSPTVAGTTEVAVTAGTVTYVDIPYYVAETRFRVRETGGAYLELRELILNQGRVISGTVVDTLGGTSAEAVWTEQAFGPHKGYPRTVTFLGNRLLFGGIRDEPALVLGSKVDDLFRFDDTSSNDDYALKFFIASDQNHQIRNIRANRNGLVVLTSDGEFDVNGGNDNPITPTRIQIKPQSRYGCANIPIEDVDGQIIYVTANRHELRSFVYEFARDQYESSNLTILAHHIFTHDRHPRRLAVLRGYLDHQAAYICVPTGAMLAIATYDPARQVLAWSRFTTGLRGKFHDVCVVETTYDPDHEPVGLLYVVVRRVIDGNTKVFIEALTEERVWLDHWYAGSADPAQATWSGLTTLANESVAVIADGLVAGDFDVNGSGQFTLEQPAESVSAGLRYTGIVRTLPIPINGDGGAIKGEKMMLKSAHLDVYDTMDIAVNGYPVRFRQLGTSLLDAPLVSFTGQKSILIANKDGFRRNPKVEFTIREPVPCTVLTLAGRIKVGI